MYKNKNLIILIFSLVLFFIFYPDVFAQEVSEFSCTEDYQEFIAPTYGVYKIELWGAAGGKNLVDNAYTSSYSKYGGNGAYTSGNIVLNEGEKLYVYVGCKGKDGKKSTIVAGGYNGGGRGDYDHSDDEASASGGGASDVRLVSGEWNDFDSLKSRIMVAGGGGGASDGLAGGYAGTLKGQDTTYSKGGSQTTGYKFGIGQDGVYVDSNVDVAGGGGGYFGGYSNSSGSANTYKTAGAGGSSFVSGCNGCVAISNESIEDDIIFLNSNIHYSNYKFENIIMKSGNEEMPDYGSDKTITGNSSNGYAKISLVKKINYFTKIDIDGVTFIQDLKPNLFEYDVIIPKNNFQTTINYETSNKNVTVFGTQNVTLESGKKHIISIIDNETGDLIIYVLNPSVEKSSLNSISFAETSFDFNSKIYNYNIDVPYDITSLTPIIEADSDTTYDIENVSLKLGSNVIKIIVKTKNKEESSYIFNVKRLDSNKRNTTYAVSGNEEEYTVPFDGYYQIELWGAAGGQGRTNYTLKNLGGNGAYTKGTIYLEKGTKLYFYIGSKGKYSASVSKCVGGLGGFNGGAQGGIDGNCDSAPEPGAGGGGASDVRLVGGTWNDFESLKSRIMVAGGGGGGSYSYVGSAAGGLNGYAGGGATTFATQISGSAFGYGVMVSSKNYDSGPGGAGGGYYGGITKAASSTSGGGGSSYISGHPGSIAINIDGTPKVDVYSEESDSYHYSNYKFEDTVMIDGQGYSWTTQKQTKDGMPTTDVDGVMYGNSEDGYARISYLGRSKEETLDSITLSSGSLSPEFDPNIREYNVSLDSSITKLTVDATSLNDDIAITGIGTYDIPAGNTDINIQLTSGTGNVNVYTLHITREASSNKYINGILINGIEYSGFEKEKFEYDIEMPASVEYIDIDVIKGSTSQEITGTGNFKFSDNFVSKTILIVSENKTESQHYILNFTREKSTKLKNIDLGNDLIKDFDFMPNTFEYDIEIPDTILQLDIDALPYYNGVSTSIEGEKYLEEEGTIIVTAKLDGLEDSVYKINYKKTSDIDSPENIYMYTGDVQTFTALYGGKYRIELWGAAGGRGRTNYSLDKFGGNGAYTSGEIILNQNQVLYLYVGGKGSDAASISKCVGGLGGFNGGAGGGIDGNCDSAPEPGAGGGGASDVRLVGGTWNDSDSLKSRIMVAAGGGGASYATPGIPAGGLNGYPGSNTKLFASQISGNAFGYATMVSISSYTAGPGGAGGGYYGGITAKVDGSAGGSGSSYISGHPGSIAINQDGTPKVTLFTTLSDSYHYSNFIFDNTVMIDGKGYNWTTKIGDLTSMPNPMGGYYNSGVGNASNGYARVTLLSTLSSNNFLDSLVINDGNISIPFQPWITEYDLELGEDDSVIKISATAKDENAIINGTGQIDVKPGNSKSIITVTASDGSVRNYVLNINRKGSSDPTPLNIEINKMSSYLCEKNANYCNYKFDIAEASYEIILPFTINEIEIKPILRTKYQKIIYRKIVDDSKIEIDNGNIALEDDISNIEVEVFSEDETQSIVYSYSFKKDTTGNNNLSSLKIINPEIEIDFDPYKYEYYATISSEYTSYDIEAIPENSDSTVSITGNNNLVLGMNNAIVIVTAPNGDTKTYLLHIYKEQDSNVFLKDLQVVNNGKSLEISPQFNKLLNDYVVEVDSSINVVTINATSESGSAEVSGIGNKTLKSGVNYFTIQVTSESGDVNIYTLTINKAKNSNPLLSNIEVEGYTFDDEFNPNNFEYYLEIPKDVTSLNLIVTPQEATTNYRITGNNNLTKLNNTIIIHSTSEDGTVKDYYIYVSKPLSSNNYLKDIKLSVGSLNETFEREKLEYTMNVSNDVDTLVVNGILEDNFASIVGDGTYYLSTGVTQIQLVVKSELEEERIYVINVTKEKNDDTSLKEIINSVGSEVVNNDTEEYQYLINVQYEVNQIEITGIPNVSTSLVTGNGKYALKTGNNDIVLSVESEKGTIKSYIVRVVRDLSANDDLKYLFVNEGALSPRFQNTTILYDVKVANDVQKLNIEAIVEDENATYEVIGNEDLVVGEEKEVIVRVTAQNGNTKDYKLKVLRQNEITDEFYLDSLSVDNGNLVPIFDPKTNLYQVEVDNDIDTIELSGTSNNSNVKVIGNGTYDLIVGKNPLAISIINEEGIQKDYQVVVTRKASSDASLKTLTIKGVNLNPKFSSDIVEYSLTTSNSFLEFTSIKPTQNDATYEILNNENFKTGQNIVTIRVTAPDKITIKDYVLLVNRNANTNNNLASLSILGNTLIPNFHKGVTTYTINVSNEINNVVIEATPEEKTSTVTGTGSHQINVGTNKIDVVVTSEAGTQKKYTIIVTKDESDNNFLANLYTSEGILTPNFDKEILEYNINVPNEVDEIEIDGKLEDLSASTNDFKLYSLNEGDNLIYITVTSQAGSVRIYKINVNREEKVSSYLKNLEIEDYDLDPEFDKENFEYFINVNNETTKLDISLETEDENANVEVSGNENFSVGMNIVTITVTATDSTTSTYEIYVNRNLSTNNYLSSIELSSGTLNPEFNPNTMNYVVDVENNISSIDINAIVQDSQSVVTVGNGTHTLITGENEIVIKVKSAIGVYRVYTLKVNRKKSDNNYLSSLIVTSNNKNIPINFEKTNNNYSINVDSSVDYINIKAVSEEKSSTVSNIGTKKINLGINNFEILVTSESGLVNVYKLTVERKASSNNNVILIKPSVGSLNVSFDPKIKEYILNVDKDDNLLSFDVTLEDSKAIVTGYEEKIITDGKSVRTITVTAEDGSTNIYTFNVIKESQSEVRLSSLKIKGYEINFDKDTFTYNIEVAGKKSKLLESEIEAIPLDNEANVNLMGDIELLRDINNKYIIEVIAKDGYTTQEYILNITRGPILENITVNKNLFKIVEGETDTILVTTDPLDFKTDIKYEVEDASIVSVDYAGLITGLSVGKTTIKVIAVEDENITKTLNIEVIPKEIKSSYSINRDEYKYIIGMDAGITVDDFLTSIENDKEYTKIYNGEEFADNSEIIKTGQIIKLEINDKVYDELIIIVRGDINGDGKINISDSVILQDYVLLKEKITDYRKYSMELTKDGKINISDTVRLNEYILKKIKTLN